MPGWVLGGPTEPIGNKYRLGKRLGEPGVSGEAKLATVIATGEERAVKVINKKNARGAYLEQLKAEFDIQNNLNHKNVIKAYEVFEDERNFYIVLEYCAGGELFARIQQKRRFTERDAAHVLRQIVEGVNYLHENKIAHCDLKPDNFLFLHVENNDDLKVIDFGMSKHYGSRSKMAAKVGTPFYMAPEIHTSKYTYHCDMWSVGVTMFILLFGFPPFHGNTNRQIQAKIEKGFDPVVKSGYGAYFPSAIPVSHEARDLMRKLLMFDPSLRISADEALEHKWLRTPGGNSDTPLANVLANLQHFNTQSRFKDVVLSALTSSLEEGEALALQANFSKLDLNGDGIITRYELETGLANARANGNSDAALEETIHGISLMWEGEGESVGLTYEELVKAVVAHKLAVKEDRVENIFQALDADEDGRLSAAEIKGALGSFLKDSDDVDYLIREVDTNQDGFIDLEEFCTMFKASKPNAPDAPTPPVSPP